MQLTVVLKGDGSGLTGTLRVTEAQLNQLGATMDRTGAQAARSGQQVGAVGAHAQRSASQARELATGLNTLRGTLATLGVAAVAREIFQAGLQMARFETTLTAVFGSGQAAAREMGFLRAESERLGLYLPTLVQGYTGLAAATRGTRLEGELTREIFLSVAEAGRVMNLSNDQIMGTLNALQQIAGKGTVSMEELRQQLGDRLPGAMQIAARSMNMTVGELVKLVSEGKLASDEFLPRFAEELRRTNAAGVELAANSPAAVFERMRTALFELAAAISAGGVMDALVQMAGEITDLSLIVTSAISTFTEFRDILDEVAASASGLPVLGFVMGEVVDAATPLNAAVRDVADLLRTWKAAQDDTAAGLGAIMAQVRAAPSAFGGYLQSLRDQADAQFRVSDSAAKIIAGLNQQEAALRLSAPALVRHNTELQALAAENEASANAIRGAGEALARAMEAQEAETAATQAATEAKRELEAQTRELTREMERGAREAFRAEQDLLDLVADQTAQLGGPAAQAARDYAVELAGIAEMEASILALGPPTIESVNAIAQARANAADLYRADLDDIDRETREANDRASREAERAAERSTRAWEDFSLSFVAAMRDGSESVKDLFRRMLDDMVNRLLASGLMRMVGQLFGAGGGAFSGGLGGVFDLFGGGAGGAGGLGGGGFSLGSGFTGVLGGAALGYGSTGSIGGALGGAAGSWVGGLGATMAAQAVAAGAIGSTLGAALGSALPVIGTLLGAAIGDWIGGLFSDDPEPRIRANASGVNIGRRGIVRGETSLGSLALNVDDVANKDDVARQLIEGLSAIDDGFVNLVRTLGLGEEQIDALRAAAGSWSIDLRNSQFTAEAVLQSRFDALLGSFSEGVQALVRDAGDIEAQFERLAEVLFVQAAAEAGGLLDQFEPLLDLLGDLRGEGETLDQTYNRVLASTLLLEEAFRVTGTATELTREQFIRFAADFVEQAGGLERAAGLWDGFYQTFYSATERAQMSLDRVRSAAGGEFEDIGLNLADFTGEGGAAALRALFEERLPSLGAEAQVAWLEALNALGALIQAQDAYNQTLNQGADATRGALDELLAGVRESANDAARTLREWDLSPLERQLGAVARQTQQNIVAARRMEASEAELAEIRAAGAAQAEVLRRQAADDLEELIGGLAFEDALAGMTDMEAQTARLNAEWERYIAQAIALGASEEQLAQIRELQANALGRLENSARGAADAVAAVAGAMETISAGQLVGEANGAARDILDMLAEARATVLGDGLTDTQRAIRDVNARFDQMIGQAQQALAIALRAGQFGDGSGQQIQNAIRELEQLRVTAITRIHEEAAERERELIDRRYQRERDWIEELLGLRRDITFREGFTTLTPQERLSAARDEYAAAVGAIDAARLTEGTEDDDAARARFRGAAELLLEIGREVYGSADPFVDIRNQVLSDIDRFVDASTAATTQTLLQAAQSSAVNIEPLNATMQQVARNQDDQTEALVQSLRAVEARLARIEQHTSGTEQNTRNSDRVVRAR